MRDIIKNFLKRINAKNIIVINKQREECLQFFCKNWDTLEKVDLFLTNNKNWKNQLLLYTPTVYKYQQSIPVSFLRLYNYCKNLDSAKYPFSYIFNEDYALKIFQIMIKHGLELNDELIYKNYILINGAKDELKPLPFGYMLFYNDFGLELKFLIKIFNMFMKQKPEQVKWLFVDKKEEELKELNETGFYTEVRNNILRQLERDNLSKVYGHNKFSQNIKEKIL